MPPKPDPKAQQPNSKSPPGHQSRDPVTLEEKFPPLPGQHLGPPQTHPGGMPPPTPWSGRRFVDVLQDGPPQGSQKEEMPIPQNPPHPLSTGRGRGLPAGPTFPGQIGMGRGRGRGGMMTSGHHPSQGQTNYAAIGRAMYFNRAHKYQEAYDLLIDISHEAGGRNITLARCLQGLNRHEEALDIYNSVLSPQPHNTQFLSGKARCLEEMGRYSEALHVYEVQLDLPLDHGRCLSQMGNHEQALVVFNQALISKPDNFQLLLGKVRVLEELGRFQEALDLYITRLRSPLDHARCLQKMKRYDEALSILGQELISHPRNNNNKFLLAKARCYEEMGMYAEALKIFSSQPRNQNFLLGYARCYQTMGRLDSALEVLENELRRDPDNKQFLLAKARCLEEMNIGSEALPIFEKLNLTLEYARCLVAMGRISEALTIIERELKKEPKNQQLLLTQARCLEKMGNLNKALAIFRALVVQSPNNQVFLLGLARCLEELGKFLEAMEILNTTNTPLDYGRCLEGQGYYDEALKQFEQDLLNTKFLLAQARCLEEMGRLSDAIKIYEISSGIKLFAPLDYARCLQVKGDYQGALKVFLRYPSKPLFLLGRARCLEAWNKHEEALLIYETQIKFPLDHARCLQEMQRYDKAYEKYKEIVNVNNPRATEDFKALASYFIFSINTGFNIKITLENLNLIQNMNARFAIIFALIETDDPVKLKKAKALFGKWNFDKIQRQEKPYPLIHIEILFPASEGLYNFEQLCRQYDALLEQFPYYRQAYINYLKYLLSYFPDREAKGKIDSVAKNFFEKFGENHKANTLVQRLLTEGGFYSATVVKKSPMPERRGSPFLVGSGSRVPSINFNINQYLFLAKKILDATFKLGINCCLAGSLVRKTFFTTMEIVDIIDIDFIANCEGNKLVECLKSENILFEQSEPVILFSIDDFELIQFRYKLPGIDLTVPVEIRCKVNIFNAETKIPIPKDDSLILDQIYILQTGEIYSPYPEAHIQEYFALPGKPEAYVQDYFGLLRFHDYSKRPNDILQYIRMIFLATSCKMANQDETRKVLMQICGQLKGIHFKIFETIRFKNYWGKLFSRGNAQLSYLCLRQTGLLDELFPDFVKYITSKPGYEVRIQRLLSAVDISERPLELLVDIIIFILYPLYYYRTEVALTHWKILDAWGINHPDSTARFEQFQG